MQVFAENLRRRAEELNLSNAEVARRAGLEERRYGNYVVGRREPDLATLLRIAAALGTSVDDLLASGDHKFSENDVLRDRLVVSAAALSEEQLRMVVVQVEALARTRAS